MKGRTPALTILFVAATTLWARPTAANEGSAGVFVRADTDDTVVVSPHVRLGVMPDSDTRIDVGYMADIWTSASIDIRTAATKPITEQRDQIDGSVSHDWGDVTSALGFYYSAENDYFAHGGSLSFTEELGQKATTLEQKLSVGYDLVGRSGDPGFSRPLLTLGARLVATQIVTPQLVIQAAYEMSHRDGYQGNPYRFVGIGGDGQCGGTADLCIPEAVPQIRNRHSVVSQARYSVAEDSSIGLGYRFYFDDWGVHSHTGIGQVAYVPSPEGTLTLRYRFYWQGAADFYESTYDMPAGPINYVTRDRELSPLFSNRLAIAYEHEFPMEGAARALSLAMAAGGVLFTYRDFVGLDNVFSVDFSLALGLKL